tara:strand:+ start:2311 stop:3528 length:1218 start_codon:yes stop_codon:yes gene_type:complete
MSLTNISSDFLNLFLPHINKINDKKHNIDKILKKIYTNIKFSNKYYNFKKDKIDKEIINLDDGNRDDILDGFGLLNDSVFVPEIIRIFIKKNVTCIEKYRFTIKNIDFSVEFIVCDNKAHVIYVKKIVILLHFLLSFFVPHISSLKISLCFSNERKMIPEVKKKILTSLHVNTAVTFSCKKDGEILLYRKEEWYKVLIHELMHSLCFDFAKLKLSFSIKNLLKEMFKINSNFNITEAYSEFWANIFHTAIISSNGLQNEDEFILNFKILNEFEKYFSIFSCIKVLDHMELSYEDIISKNPKEIVKSLSLYKEDTNVFAYHILKSIWLFNTEDMLLWFDKRNNNVIFSKKDNNYVLELIKKTEKLYKTKKYIDNIKFVEELFYTIKKDSAYNELITTLRMTIVDLN